MVSTNLLNIDNFETWLKSVISQLINIVGQFDKKVNHIKGEFNIATP